MFSAPFSDGVSRTSTAIYAKRSSFTQIYRQAIKASICWILWYSQMGVSEMDINPGRQFCEPGVYSSVGNGGSHFNLCVEHPNRFDGRLARPESSERNVDRTFK
jgi:hypothetical protein